MSWRCSGCSEVHEDAFRSCWRCGASRAPTATEAAEEDEETRVFAAEEAVEDAELERQAAVEKYEAATGWHEAVTSDRSTATDQALHRFTVAYRYYRARQDAGFSQARPDLDRLWTQFFVCCAVMGGAFLSSFMPVSVLDLLVRSEPLALGFLLGGLIACMFTGHRAVSRELRAAAEAAVDRGDEPGL